VKIHLGIAPDYIITTPAVKLQLVDLMRQTIRQFYGANIQKSKDYIRIVNERHFDRLQKLLETTNGRVLFKGGEPDRADLFIPPTIVGKLMFSKFGSDFKSFL
jgi:aldehyde dehydrogenase (NAD+)